MKFSYRLIFLTLCGVTAVVILATYTNKWYREKEPASKAALVESKEWSRHVIESSPTFKPAVKDVSECVFGHQKKAKSDVCTFNLLEKINDGQKPVGTGEEDPGVKLQKTGPLKVIVVPHSHNDPGWHKTVDGYFADQTKHILNNMVGKLLKYPKMTFVWAETVFLDLWWRDLDHNQREAVRKLIENRQLEIVSGSWIVPDEANPHYSAVIDQMIEGHQWLERNLGIKPNNTWSLDPFGYTSTFPYLYQRAGYKHMVILRVHEAVKGHLIDRKALEFRWRQHWDIHGQYDIPVQMMPYKLYNIKHTCGPDHHICVQFDFRQIPGEISESRASPITPSNVDRQAKLLLSEYQKKAQLFRHNVVLVPLGDDFRYDRSVEWDQQFKNYQLLFNYLNSKPGWNVHAKFGTIQDYFDEVAKVVSDDVDFFPTLTGDFFPYTDERDEYWTGYYTTRPFDKLTGRELESLLRTAEMLHVLSTATATKTAISFVYANENVKNLEEAHQSLGLFQHHDAITGTARSYVAEDYRKRLLEAIVKCQTVIKNSLQYLLSTHPLATNNNAVPVDVVKPRITIDIDNPSSLESIRTDPKVLKVLPTGTEVAVFNPLVKRRSHLVRIAVDTDIVEVFDINGHIVPSQMNPIWLEPTVMEADKFELLFYVDLQPTELRVFTLKQTLHSKVLGNGAAVLRLYNQEEYPVPRSARFPVLPPDSSELVVLENEAYRMRFSPRTGLLHSVTTKAKIHTTKINLQFLMYRSRGSGAYIFYPTGPAVDAEFSNRPLVRVIKGPLTSEVHVIQKWIEHRVVLHNTSGILANAIEIKNFADLRQTQDKELIMRFSTDIDNVNETFCTDLNGYQMMTRKRFPHFSAQANYYPMTTMAYIEDGFSRFSVLSAQSHGVSSLQKGWLEVMLDRRLLFDDGRGLGEGVMDNRRTPSTFYIVLERANTKPLQKRTFPDVSHPSLLAQTLSDNLNRPISTIFILNRTIDIPKSMELVGASLPCDVTLVSLKNLSPALTPNQNSPTEAALVLHRRAFDCDFPSANLQCTTNGGLVNLLKLFRNYNLIGAKEMTLSLMHEKQNVKLPVPLKLQQMDINSYKLSFK